MLFLSERHLSTLEAAQRGEPAAIADVLRLCQPDVRRYAQRHCLISDIDDAVQETLLVLARKLHQLTKLALLSAWLFRIVQRTCRKLGRAAFAYDPFEEEKVELWLADRPADAIARDLVAAFDSLPAHYREVLLLRDFAGLTIAEIASQLALSTAATKSRLHRARELTREYLLS